ncbi:MAG: hypothetical protein AB7U98_11215 [Candidatus Nitrosocosmicus sp.]|jgi:hypothetical protein|uniref:hypothetical protein n=1 Tax=Candidatus Nitrosocosmicus sp. FF01 TaxID=3397670 RepID=UPI002A6EDD8A|nr:hypothetical protein [Candidatus Nitrosocosmicus sp.]GKS61650.1 hypothetical protein YTPLAS21_11080 [Candidatus Nitrosocosmicus sp.]
MINVRKIKMMIKKCIYEENTDAKIKLFIRINNLLPKELRIESPTMITKDFIDKGLYLLEGKLENKLQSTSIS